MIPRWPPAAVPGLLCTALSHTAPILILVVEHFLMGYPFPLHLVLTQSSAEWWSGEELLRVDLKKI